MRTYTTIHGKKKNVYFAENHAVINGRKNGRNDAEARSKTFPGVAKAMAEQGGNNMTLKAFVILFVVIAVIYFVCLGIGFAILDFIEDRRKGR